MTDLADWTLNLAPNEPYAPANKPDASQLSRKINRPLSPAAEREILSWLKKSLDDCKPARVPFERQWYMNLAFYGGKQYVQWITSQSGNYSRLLEPDVPAWRVRAIINKTRAMVRTELSKITKERPRGYVIPSSSDEEDLMAARAGDAILEHLLREKKYARVLRRALFWTVTMGTGFIKDWYDPFRMDSQGLPGDICIEPVSCFNLWFPDLLEEEVENQPYFHHGVGRDPAWLRQAYGFSAVADTPSSKGAVDQRFLSALNLSQMNNKTYTTVYETWVKPGPKFVEGAMITWTESAVLNMFEGWPFQHKEYPITKFDHIPTGRFYAESTITDFIPLQKEYNRTRSQIIEAKNRMSKPQLIAPRGSVDANKITSEPGLIIYYTPGMAPPAPLPLQNLPPYVIEELTRLQSDMNDISSQHEITKGSTPPGVTAATAISYLQEEDDSKLSPTISSIEEGTEKVCQHMLSHVHMYWDFPRKVKVTGQNDQYEAHVFEKSDVKGNTDWRVEHGSATPRSRAAKQAFLMEMGDKGWIPPAKVLHYLDMGETGRLYEETQIDTRQSQRENLFMRDGKQVTPNSFDNHLTHIMEHTAYCKKESFEMLDPEIKQVFEMHTQAHKLHVANMFGHFEFVRQSVDPQTGQAVMSVDPQIDGFIYSVMAGQIPPPPQSDPQQMPQQTSQQQSSVQDAGQAQ